MQKDNKIYFENKKHKIKIIKDDFIETSLVGNYKVDLIITSPPYNLDIHYNSHKDDITYEQYLDFTRKWLKKAYDV